MTDTKDEFKKVLKEFLAKCARPWRTIYGDIFVDTQFKDSKHTFRIDSLEFEGWIRELLEERFGINFPAQSFIDNVIQHIKSKASYSGQKRDIDIRVTGNHETLWYDLGANGYVRIGADGWEIVKESPVKFYRPKIFQDQVIPARGGSLDMLKPYFRTKDDKDFYMLVGWMIGCLNPCKEYPILVINGPQGSSKSTVTQLIKKIIDPSAIVAFSPPREERDLVSFVKNAYVVGLDNVSFIKNDLSDALCRIATNSSGPGGRTLYTQDDLSASQAARPIILNGIPDFIEQPDISERGIQITLPTIAKQDRVPTSVIYERFNKDLPLILGALFDACATAIRNREVVVSQKLTLPRMADFCLWIAASAEALGLKSQEFASMYEFKSKEASATLIEDNDLAQAVLTYLRQHGTLTGTIRDINKHLSTAKPLDGNWPENNKKFHNALKRLEPPLKVYGVEFKRHGRDPSTNSTIIELYLPNKEVITSASW